MHVGVPYLVSAQRLSQSSAGLLPTRLKTRRHLAEHGIHVTPLRTVLARIRGSRRPGSG
ncbi:hypothetical protein [Nocardia pseudovaccinii]|uniref:hypothetical protein n=1 Tax=Nocardia pseudovaccinii TaxID=189540 RepID=UPI000ACF3CA9|nr:hypothetical protein [Nocardia pseudovaccinii]